LNGSLLVNCACFSSRILVDFVGFWDTPL
jgi:hypothetical protein